VTLFTNSFEGGTNGTTLTAGAGGNTGGTSGNFFDTVTIVASGTNIFDNTHAAHGTLANKLATGATAGTNFDAWDTSFGSAVGQVWFRQYLYLTANPGASFRSWSAFSAPAGSQNAGLQINTGGTLTFQDANGTAITGMTTTETIPLNQWCRIEGFVIGSATVGQVELKIFFGANPDATTPTNTYTSAATVNTRGNMGSWRYGINTSRANVVAWWQDDLGLSNTGYVGPVVTLGPAGQVEPWPTIPVPRRTLARALFGGLRGAGFAQVPAPGQGPYMPPRRVPARALWAGSKPFTGYVAVPAPPRLPPHPRRTPARALWAGSKPFPGFVAVPAPVQGPYRPPRLTPARALGRGVAAPTLPTPVAAPPELSVYPRRVPARAYVRFTPVTTTNGPPSTVHEAAQMLIAPDDKSHIKKLIILT
jgi:hypothetical protein